MATAAYLAYEPADEAAALAVAAELERNGWTLTRSSAELRQDQASLVKAIAAAELIVLVASPASEASAFARREIAAALSNGRTVLLAQAGDVPADGWINATLDLSQAIDVRGEIGAQTLDRITDSARGATGRGRVIAMLNIKGGVGKTVLAANLFAAAHLADKRSISFIDLDPQHNLTQYFIPPGERNKTRDEARTIHGVLTGAWPREKLADLALPLNRVKRGKGLTFELISGDERLFEYTLDTRSERERAEAFTRFRALVSYLRARSDAVIIDSNPCATFLTRLAITTADHIVAPVRPERYSLSGLNMLENVVREVRGRTLRPEEFTVLLNGVADRTRSTDGDADALTRAEIAGAPFFGAALLEHEIPYAGVLRSAPTERFAINPINVTAMMRVGQRRVKESLAAAAAGVLRRASS